MSKKTLALIAGLTVLTLILVVLALNVGQKPANESGESTTVQISPTIPSYAVVGLNPDPVSLSGNTATIDVTIDTAGKMVTGAQFDVVYDPQVFTISPLRLGTFFANSNVLLNNISTPGRATYLVGLTPAQIKSPKSGRGTIATITLTKRSTAPSTGSSEIKLENVKIPAPVDDTSKSVLKQATGTTINLSSSGN